MNARPFSLLLLLLAISPLQAASPLQGKIIVLDPGHGVLNFEGRIINPGKDSRDGHTEHQLTMDMAKKLGEMLENEGATVFYTRTLQDYWRQSYSTVQDNKSRALLANEVKAQAYISIHCDWYPSKKFQGITTFYTKPESKTLAEMVHHSLIHQLKAHDRNVVHDSYTVLDVCEVPAILVETGFLSHKTESKKLIKPSYQKEIAAAITAGLRSYFSN